MCGIVAIISKRPTYGFTGPEVDAFKTMLLVDSLRGEDSTGIFAVESNGNVHIAKEASHSGVFIQSQEMDAIRGQMIKNGWVIAGHNRKATRGSINDKNAHPFWKDDKVVLLHNGTFNGDHKKHADTEVDSEAIAHLLASHEPDQVEQVFNKIDAAYATMWYDVRNQTFNVLRNTQRPVWFMNAQHCWILASEPDFIEFAMKREKLLPEKDSIPKFLLEDNLMQCSIDNGKLKIKAVPLKIEKKVYHGTTYVGNNQHKDACAWDPDDLSNWPYVGQRGNAVKQEPIAAKIVETKPANNTVVQLLPSPTTTQTSTVVDRYQGSNPPFKVGDVMDKIITELGDTPSFLRYTDWRKVQNTYPVNHPAFFDPKNIIPFKIDGVEQEKFILYGPLSDDPDIYGVCVIDEQDFCKIIDVNKKNQKIQASIKYTSWRRNKDEGGGQNEWEGYAFLHMEHPKVVDTEIVDA